jgi:hypothetical protein
MVMPKKELEFNNANPAQGNIVFGGPQMNAPAINQVNGQFGLGLDLAIKAAPGALYPAADVVIGGMNKGVVNLAGVGIGAIHINVGAKIGAPVNVVYEGLEAIDLAGVVAIHAPDPAPAPVPVPVLGEGDLEAPSAT